MAENRTKKWVWRPPRVRYEPPTIDEAVAAAQDLSSDAGEQLEIAASLMGVSVEEVKPAAGQLIRSLRRGPTLRSRAGGSGTVIIERKIRRRVKTS